MGPLNAIVQDSDHDVPVASLSPGSFNVLIWLAGMCVVTAVLKEEEGKKWTLQIAKHGEEMGELPT